jgi:hypothetical protein
MSYYSVALFLHITGALGFFVALGVELISLRQLVRSTAAEQAQEWLRIAVGVRRLGFASMMLLLASGLYMMVIAQVGGAWLIVAFWSLVLLAILAVALSYRRMAAIGRALAAEVGPVSPALRNQLHYPLLWIAIKLRVAIALGIVFLMTVKPDLGGSLLVIGVAAVLGIAFAVPMLSRKAALGEPAT